MSMFSSTKQKLAIFSSATAIASVAIFAGGASPSSAATETSAQAAAKCQTLLRQPCEGVQAPQVRKGCVIYRSIPTKKVGRTYGCPGSPAYVY